MTPTTTTSLIYPQLLDSLGIDGRQVPYLLAISRREHIYQILTIPHTLNLRTSKLGPHTLHDRPQPAPIYLALFGYFYVISFSEAFAASVFISQFEISYHFGLWRLGRNWRLIINYMTCFHVMVYYVTSLSFA
jgi:hypothetical protein